jgi:hypothetical protein
MEQRDRFEFEAKEEIPEHKRQTGFRAGLVL